MSDAISKAIEEIHINKDGQIIVRYEGGVTENVTHKRGEKIYCRIESLKAEQAQRGEAVGLSGKALELWKAATNAEFGAKIEVDRNDFCVLLGCWKAAVLSSAHHEQSRQPVAWKHSCAALLTDDVEFWIDRCPHCGKPRPEQARQDDWQPIESAPLDGKPLLLGWYTTWPEVIWVCAIAPAGMDGGRQGQNYRHGMATHWKPHPESVELSVIPPICSNCQSFMPAGCRGLFESDEACMRKQHPEGIAQ